MATPLNTLLSGAKDVLGSDNGQVIPAGDNGAAKPAPSPQPVPTSTASAPQPVPKPTPSGDTDSPMVPAGDGGPIVPAKRIAMPSGAVLEVPGHWTDGVVNTLARELHAATQTVMGLPSAIYHSASDPETPEESERFGKGFESKLGPTGRVIDRTMVQPLVNAVEDYKAGRVSIDDVLANLPEALGGAGGALVAGKVASDVVGGAKNAIEKAVETPQGAARSGYRGSLPKNLKGSARIQWLDDNSTKAAKLDTIRHELAHAHYALDAGHPVDDMGLYAGHGDVKVGGQEGFSQATTYTDDTFWRKQMNSAKTPSARTAAATAFLKHLLAPERVEELQGYSPEEIKESTASDNAQADEFMRKRLKLKPDEAAAVKNQIRQQLKNEINEDTMKRYTHAAKQIVDNHYGGPVPPKAIEHYLNLGTYDDLPEELKPQEPEAGEPEMGVDLSRFGLPDLNEILGRGK